MEIQFLREFLAAVLDELRSYRTACITLFVVIMFACLIVAMNWPDKYSTSALVQADRKSVTTDLLRGRAAIQEVPPVNIAEEIIRSRLILKEAATELGIINEQSSPKEIDQAINRLSGSFDTKPLNNNLLRINLRTSDPKFSYESLDAVVTSFINSATRQKQIESLEAVEFFDSAIQVKKAELAAAEKRRSDFKKQNMDGTEGDVANRINQLHTDLDTLSINIDEVTTRIASIENKIDGEREYQKAKTQLSGLTAQRSELQKSLDELLLIGTEKHPDVILRRSQIAELDGKISKLQVNVPGSYSGNQASEEVVLFEVLRQQKAEAEVQLDGMRTRQRSLESQLANQRSRAEKIANNEAELAELDRDYNTTQETYNSLLEDRQNAELSASISREGKGMSYRVREHPVLPLQPSGLQAIHFIMLGPILGLLAPIGLMGVFVYLDPRIRTPERLKLQLPDGIDLLGSIPSYRSEHSGAALSRRDISLLAIGAIALIAYAYSAFAWISA